MHYFRKAGHPTDPPRLQGQESGFEAEAAHSWAEAMAMNFAVTLVKFVCAFVFIYAFIIGVYGYVRDFVATLLSFSLLTTALHSLFLTYLIAPSIAWHPDSGLMTLELKIFCSVICTANLPRPILLDTIEGGRKMYHYMVTHIQYAFG